MPAWAPLRPRKMLPPPTTIAISTSRSRRTSATSAAMRETTSPSMPWAWVESANASPDSLSTTRVQRAGTALPPDLHLGEARDRRVAEQLLDRLLGILGVLLL